MIDRAFERISAVAGRLFSNGPTVLAAMVVLFGVGLHQQLSSIINHDTAWYLYATGKFLDGAKLYVDIVEVNPPLAFYLTVPGILLSRATGLFVVDAFVIYVFALIALSLFLAHASLLRDSQFPAAQRHAILLATLAGLGIYPMMEFGQREHLMLVLSFPYLSLAAMRVRCVETPITIAAAIGILAGIGYALKPHFLLAPMVVEVYVALQAHRLQVVLRPETFCIALVAIVYAVCVALLTPEYLGTVVPYALLVYDNAYSDAFFDVVRRRETVLLPMVLIVQLATRKFQPLRSLSDVFCIAAVVFFLTYLVQMKGWTYQLYPSSILWLVALVAIVPGVLNWAFSPSRRVGVRRMASATAFVAMITGVWIFAGTIQRGSYQNAFMDLMLPLVEQHAHESSIFVFSAHVVAPFPLVVYANVEWASRFPSLWLMPGLVRQQQRADSRFQQELSRLEEIRRYINDSVIEDLAKSRPALIIVDERAQKPYFGEMPFDYLGYFGMDQRFREIWSSYERIAEWEDFEIYVDRRR